jgi:hypothetical protein
MCEQSVCTRQGRDCTQPCKAVPVDTGLDIEMCHLASKPRSASLAIHMVALVKATIDVSTTQHILSTFAKQLCWKDGFHIDCAEVGDLRFAGVTR